MNKKLIPLLALDAMMKGINDSYPTEMPKSKKEIKPKKANPQKKKKRKMAQKSKRINRRK